MTTITTSTGDKLPHLAPIIQSQQPSLPRPSSSSSSSYVPRLYDLCKHVLRANVAHIVDVGDVPYDMISDVLHSCRVEQLREIEELSPHIAEEDEEIWEFFFKRDFPIVAEARAASLASDKAKTLSSKASQHEYQRSSAEAFSKTAAAAAAAAPKSSTEGTRRRKILTNKEYHDNGFKTDDDDDDEEEDDDDHLFTSYRDLYYDEQVRREERLASAGERLKERLNHLAQVKSSRQTILDPRLSLNLRKRRKGQTLPTGRMLAAARGQYSSSRGQQQQQPLYRTKSLAERARAKASMIAQHRSQPPPFTRSASMSVGLIPPRPKPLYKEDSLDSIGSGQPHIARKGIYGPRRMGPVGPAAIAAGTSSSATARQTQGSNGTTTTTFVERTVVVPVKSTIDKPYKSSKKLDRSPPGKTRVPALPSRDVDSATEHSKHKAKDLSPSAPPVPVAVRNIPGITRRQQPVKRTSDSVGMVPSVEIPANKAPAPIYFSNDANPAYAWNNLSRIQISPPSTPATSSAGSPPATSAYSDTNSGPTSPPLMPSSNTNTLPPSLPMFSQPRRTTPSLFIPRKKPRTTK